jgi:hypothetical protein
MALSVGATFGSRHISKGLIDDARGEESVGGRSLHALGERLANNTHLKSLVTIRGAESSNWTSLADLTEPGWRHAWPRVPRRESFGEGCYSGSGRIPRRRCGSAQESETSRGYALSEAHATELFRGTNADERVAEKADAWRLTLMQKGFREIAKV